MDVTEAQIVDQEMRILQGLLPSAADPEKDDFLEEREPRRNLANNKMQKANYKEVKAPSEEPSEEAARTAEAEIEHLFPPKHPQTNFNN